MSLHKNLSGAELHYPLGRSSEGTLLLEDDLSNAYQIAQGSDNQFNVSTINGSEELTFGNGSQNPKFTFSGTGLFSSGGGHKYKTATLTGAGGSHDLQNESHVLFVDTSSGTEQLNLPNPGQVTDQIFLIIDKESSFGSNNLVLARAASEKIDNTAANKTISDSGARLWLFCDGTDWFTFLDGESQAGAGGTAWDGTSGSAPVLGGNLDGSSYNILLHSTKGILDESGNGQILFTKTTTAVNYLNITNAATGGEATAATSTAPIIAAAGESNTDLALEAAGTGAVTVRANTNAATLALNTTGNTKAVNITVPLVDSLTSSYTLTLPSDDGDADEVLQTDGSGNLSWAAQAGGSLTIATTSSATYALATYNTMVIADSSSNAVEVDLPTAAGNAGKTIDVLAKTGATNAVTVDPDGSETINGSSSSLVLSGSDYQNVTLVSDGTNWVIR